MKSDEAPHSAAHAPDHGGRGVSQFTLIPTLAGMDPEVIYNSSTTTAPEQPGRCPGLLRPGLGVPQ